MPNWKKVIVSGSDATLNSLTTPAGTINNLTASYAMTASYSNNLQISGSINNVNYIDFNTGSIIGTNAPAYKEGRLFYDSGSGALAMYNWEADVTLNIGQEQWLRARNQTGVTITNGSVVKLVSAIGDRPTIALAQSVDQTNTFNLDNDIIGMATHDIENGTDGFVTTFGTVNGLNTSAYAAGDLLWVSQSAGQFTKTAPAPPFDKTFVGIVVRSNPINGAVFMTPLTSIHFHDISSVSASAYQQGDLWMYRSGSVGQANAWINTKQLSGSYAITGSLTATSFTGSLLGTASFASTASFINVTGSNAFVQGGNSFSTTALLGTNDNQSLAFETSGSTRMFISSSGIIGVGTTTPNASALIDIASTTKGLLLPRTNLTSNISSPAQGLMTYITSSATEGLYYYSSGSIKSWTRLLNDTGSQSISGSLSITQNITSSRAYFSASNGTNNGPTLTVYGSGSAQPVLTVQGSQGELFSITDSLSGSLYSVNDISGLPILEVFSDNTVLIGNYQDPMLITTTKLVTTASGAFTLYSLPTASYDTAFFEYSIKSGSNARAGSIMAIQSGTSVNFTETTTTDFGSTSGFGLTVQVAGANMILTGSATTSGWTIKTIVRSI